MTMKARYTVIDGEVIAEKRNGVRSLYVPDPLGSTVALLDSTQAQTDTFSYWPYGENDARTGATATPFQFVGSDGYYRDSGARAYVRARTLKTEQGRWLTVDPLWPREPAYQYVYAVPTSYTDASGKGGLCLCSASPLWPPKEAGHEGKLFIDCSCVGLRISIIDEHEKPTG